MILSHILVLFLKKKNKKVHLSDFLVHERSSRWFMRMEADKRR